MGSGEVRHELTPVEVPLFTEDDDANTIARDAYSHDLEIVGELTNKMGGIVVAGVNFCVPPAREGFPGCRYLIVVAEFPVAP